MKEESQQPLFFRSFGLLLLLILLLENNCRSSLFFSLLYQTDTHTHTLTRACKEPTSEGVAMVTLVLIVGPPPTIYIYI